MQTNLILLTYTAPCIINIHWGLTQSMKSNLLKKNPQHCCWNFVIGMTQVAQTCKLRDTGKLCYKWLDVPHVSKPHRKMGRPRAIAVMCDNATNWELFPRCPGKQFLPSLVAYVSLLNCTNSATKAVHLKEINQNWQPFDVMLITTEGNPLCWNPINPQ